MLYKSNGVLQALLNVPRPSVLAWSVSSSRVLLPAVHISPLRFPFHISFPEPPIRASVFPRLPIPLFAVDTVVCLRAVTLVYMR